MRRGHRSICGGRADVRSGLYMATVAVMRCNPLIQPFARRLTATAKAYKLAMIACMRKLLTILNVMVKINQHWRTPLVQKP